MKMPYRNMDCEKYDECLTYASEKNLLNLGCDTCVCFSNHKKSSGVSFVKIPLARNDVNKIGPDMIHANMAATILGVAREMMVYYRKMEKGPKPYRIGRLFYYRSDDVYRFKSIRQLEGKI